MYKRKKEWEVVTMKQGLWYILVDTVSLVGWQAILEGKDWWEIILDILDIIMRP